MKLGGLVVALCLCALIVSPSRAQSNAGAVPDIDPRDREGCVAALWELFNDDQHDGVTSLAPECLDEWIDQAYFDQDRILADGGSCPANGAVPPGERTPIFNNGVLNDVGAMLWMLGRSHQALGDMVSARETYEQCADLVCARVWDPQGWFWAPAENCQARLSRLDR